MIARRNFLAMGVLVGAGMARAGSFDDFFVAIARDNASDIDALLRRGFDPNTRNAKGSPGIVAATELDSLQAAAALLRAPNLDVNARNAADETAIMLAALRGHAELVDALLAREADVNQTGWTPLHYAASGTTDEQPRIISALLEHYAFIDAASPNGSTPLMMAAQYGTSDSVNLLIKEGADPSLRNQLNLTAVDFALRAERRDMALVIANGIRRRQGRMGRW